MATKNKSFFWASYADLMTSLFFLMVVLFITSIILYKQIDTTPEELARLRYKVDSLESHNSVMVQLLDSMVYLTNATQAHIDKINEINDATKNLSSEYFVYDHVNKKHKLRFDVRFQRDDDNIENIQLTEREKLLSVGKELQIFIDSAASKTPDVQYLLVVEGQASRDEEYKMDYNYDLSYRRAKNLKKYWDANDIKFGTGNCEVLISGSGDGRLSGTGMMRETEEVANQRFLIHILPKPGKIQ